MYCAQKVYITFLEARYACILLDNPPGVPTNSARVADTRVQPAQAARSIRRGTVRLCCDGCGAFRPVRANLVASALWLGGLESERRPPHANAACVLLSCHVSCPELSELSTRGWSLTGGDGRSPRVVVLLAYAFTGLWRLLHCMVLLVFCSLRVTSQVGVHRFCTDTTNSAKSDCCPL